ncbi:MAG: flavin oxidoreductase [Microbacteriaceae bacterium]|jgi:flavin reductase (DIM6/NTAB) family NADH-FMN oxidoreductase RutF|nr:flavin oxidoreductase [Microbacteriaceae bacterium]HEV7957435.1 flavin reductase family protein [Marisediminicola sp.]
MTTSSTASTNELGLTTGRLHVIDTEMPVLSAEEFKAAFRNHPAGVAVITADAGDGPAALTATSVFSVSADPPLLVFSLSATSSSTPTLMRAETVVVHLLTSAQLDIALLGSTSGIDRFADKSIWSRLETGEPYFTAAPVWIRGKVVDRMEAGASTVLAVEALEARTPERDSPEADADHSRPLVYHNRTWHELSEASKLHL